VPLALRAAIVLVVPLLDTRHWIQSCRLNLAIRRASGDFRLAPPFPLIVRKGTERGYLLNHPFGHPVATPVASLFWICATSFKVLFRIACAVPYTQHGLPPVSCYRTSLPDSSGSDPAGSHHTAASLLTLLLIPLSVPLLQFLHWN
jgi:hypothetical protein